MGRISGFKNIRTYQPKIYWLYYNHKINAQLFLQQDHKMGKFNQYQDTTDGLIQPVAHTVSIGVFDFMQRCTDLSPRVATCRQGRS